MLRPGLVSEFGWELCEVRFSWPGGVSKRSQRAAARLAHLAPQLGRRGVSTTITQRREFTVQAAPGELGNHRNVLDARLDRGAYVSGF